MKKKVFGIALFLVFGFLIFTFANPRNDNEGMENNDIIKPTPTATATATPEPTPTATPEENNNQQENTNNQQQNNNGGQQVQPVPIVEPVVPVPTATPAPTAVPVPTASPVVPVPTSTPEPVVDLTEDKEKAKKELKDYNKDELYSDENQKKVNDIKEEGYKKIDDAKTLDEIKDVLKEKEDEIDKIQKLTDTYFDVTFVLFDGSETTQKVLYNNAATAPATDDVTVNRVTYTFDSWDKAFTNIKEDTKVTAIYKVSAINAVIKLVDGENTTTLGNIDLTVTEDLANIAKTNADMKVSEIQSEIEKMVIGNLPKTKKLNYKYTFNALNYVANDGFVIEGIEEIDEEELAKNTVKITYIINGDAEFADGTKESVSTTYTGSNTINLPAVYRNGKIAKVNWKDANNELKESYTSSITITATLDTTAPVITLKGLVNREVVESKDASVYAEEGFTVTDNYTELTNNDVKVSITKDGQTTDKVTLNVPGTYVITYTVEDTEGNIGTATRTIKVNGATLTSISLSKTYGEYFVKDAMENIVVTAHYNNGSSKVVTATVTGFSTENPTTYKNGMATFDYQGKKAYYTYKVKAITVEKIELSKAEGTYFVKDEMEAITVTAYYNNGKTEDVTSLATVSGFKTDRAKTNAKATFSFGGKSATYKYTVKAVELVNITLSKTSGEYFVKDAMENIVVTAHYNNNTTKDVTSSTTVSGFKTDKAKVNAKATFKYEGKKAYYTYTVKAVELVNITLSKTSGEYFVKDAMENIVVTAHYNNNTSKVVTASVSGFDTRSAKVNAIATFTYEGKKAYYTYTVKNIELESISLSRNNDEYYVGDSMNAITVTAHYNNGTSKTIYEEECFFYCTDGYTKTAFDSRRAGTYTVTYTYNGKKASYNYTVKELVATELVISSTKGTYVVGDSMDKITVTVKYNNGKSYDVTSLATISGFSTAQSNVGNGKTATISYSGLNVTYTYDVKYKATLTKTEEIVGYGFDAHRETVYFIKYEIPNNASVRGMVGTDENGNSYTVFPTSWTNSKYYITKEDYDKIKKMTGNNPKQTFVVTYSVDGTVINSTYTKVISN